MANVSGVSDPLVSFSSLELFIIVMTVVAATAPIAINTNPSKPCPKCLSTSPGDKKHWDDEEEVTEANFYPYHQPETESHHKLLRQQWLPQLK